MKLIFVTATFIAVSLGVCIHAQTLNNATSTSNSMSLTATKAASDPHWTGCATRNFNILKDGKHEGKVDKTRLKTSRLSFPLDVETWFHVIHDGSEGDVSDDDVKKQVEVMNSDYNSTMLFRFKLAGITRTENKDWFGVGPETPQNTAMKKHLRKGDKSTLNIYLANLGGGILGYSTFPQDYKKNPQDDGVVILYSSIPNGSRAPYNLGKTAVHEVGHWMGLYHVFEGGCAYPGDFVEDTTPQKESTSGCPSAPKKSCSANDFNNPDDQVTFAIDDSDPSRTDMIHNVMDYSDDVCFNSKAAIFTKGQTKRMHGNWLVLRGKL